MGPVENEDYVSSLLRFASGARGTLEASRVAVGEQNNYGFEIHGTKGAVHWDYRRMGELGVSTGTAYQDQPVSTVYVGPSAGYYGAFQPGSANSMGYDDLKVIEVYNFLRSIAEGTPYGSTLDDAVRSAVGFNYRNAPAVSYARDLINSGELGSITHARIRLFSDYAAHPEGALSWRFERERGGSGVLGDLASHAVDLARYLLGDITSLVSDTATFLTERARPTGATSGHARATGGELGPVENEDYVSSLLRFASGARGTLEASRVAVGEQNNYGFEIHGTKGAVFWDFRRMGELGVSVGTAYQDQAVSTVYVGPTHGDYAAFQPGSASSLSYDDLKVIEAYNFLRSIVEGKPYGSTLDDAVRSAVALDAMSESAATGQWVTLL